jgi:ABC-type branched-subunit amino acid transport system ATPase component/branched-subunit amino acid ABC-type transport system permease component
VDKLLALVVSGAVTGAIYSLVASGLTLTYSATGIFNFSYGAIAFSAAYIYYTLNTGLHWPIALAGVVVIGVFAPLLGLLLNYAVFRPLARATESAKIMATVGLLLAIPALTQWGLDGIIAIAHANVPNSSVVLQTGFPPGLAPVPQVTWHLPGQIPITSNELVVFIAAAICAFGLWFLMRRTPLGLQMRAVVDRHQLAQTRGINDSMTSRYAWIVGTMLAALAGVVGAPILGAISVTGFLTITFVAAAAAVVGGLRSIPWAFAGGLMLGVIQNLVNGYLHVGINGFNSAVPFIVLLVALIFLARDRSRRGGSTADDVPPPDYLKNMPQWRRALPWAIATAFLVVYIIFLANDFWAGVMAQGLALSIIFLSFVVVTGMGGMVSLAQATFCSTAGLATGLLFNQYHIPFFLAALLALIATALIGIVVALPALRLGGLPLALATLALALLGDNVLFQWNYFDNTSNGWTIPRIKIGPIDLISNRTMAITLLIVAALIMVMINNLKKSPWGRSIAAVRSSEIAASTSGVAPLRVKLALFSISAVIAGLGGIFYTSYQTNASSGTTPALDGLLWLATVVLFGIRRPVAAVFAGVMSATTTVLLQTGFHWWSWVPSWLSWNGTTSSEIPLILFGLGAVGLARDPDGFISHTAAQNHARRAKRAARRAAIDAGLPPAVASASPAGVEAIMSEDASIDAELVEHEGSLIGSGAVHGGVIGDQIADESAILQIKDLHVSYGDVEVLHGLSLSIETGKITSLFGVNGSGKSTLCSTISGLVRASSGSILVDGADVVRIPAYKRVNQGVIVAPESRGIFPGLSVEENLALRLNASERDAVYARFSRLGERRRLLAGSLSGGEQQLLALAPVLIKPPRVVIADEPTLGLAPLVIAELLELFQELRDLGTTILLVEEKVRDVLSIADQVAFIELGHIVWSGARDQLDDEQLVGAYLGAKL